MPKNSNRSASLRTPAISKRSETMKQKKKAAPPAYEAMSTELLIEERRKIAKKFETDREKYCEQVQTLHGKYGSFENIRKIDAVLKGRQTPTPHMQKMNEDLEKAKTELSAFHDLEAEICDLVRMAELVKLTEYHHEEELMIFTKDLLTERVINLKNNYYAAYDAVKAPAAEQSAA